MDGFATCRPELIMGEQEEHIINISKTKEDGNIKVYPLSEFDRFSMSELSIKELKAIYKEGFILSKITDNGRFVFDRFECED